MIADAVEAYAHVLYVQVKVGLKLKERLDVITLNMDLVLIILAAFSSMSIEKRPLSWTSSSASVFLARISKKELCEKVHINYWTF